MNLFLFSISYLLVATSCLALGHDKGLATVLWAPNAILLAVLVARKKRRWGSYVFGCLIAGSVANALVGQAMLAAVGFAAIRMFEVLIAAHILAKKRGKSYRLRSAEGFMEFTLVAGVIAPLLAIVLSFGTSYLTDDVPPLSTTRDCFLADGLGILLVAPNLLRPCENSSGSGDGGLDHHDLPRSQAIGGLAPVAPRKGVEASLDRCGLRDFGPTPVSRPCGGDQGGNTYQRDRAADVVSQRRYAELAAHVFQPPGQEGTLAHPLFD